MDELIEVSNLRHLFGGATDINLKRGGGRVESVSKDKRQIVVRALTVYLATLRGVAEMSTNDVPGANPSNNDELKMGAWAEHKDGSLMLVQSTEANRVIYEMFDMAKTPPIAYRDAMAEVTFKKTFSWDPRKPSGSGSNEKWTWHDKTPFPWDRVIQAGVTDGPRPVSAESQLTAAERVAESLKLRGRTMDEEVLKDLKDKVINYVDGIWTGIKKALDNVDQRGR